ncbi:Oidioi.mRNA.OKI2018_I69.XSR.g16662.t1.cds [Oikopleura dioica]|uniref:Oidioi.mRNA.OKI2018_I69.XSR.g16662.t1.cds n=1 Tax=Oikopleura dioica TaxID=34765 RepID=A0ABN7SGV4_OIKDI|nr:Oidioi.mRNA.OKI2018_I69.XSR.g16662.t1.cds [Oikopleura dioica]
MLQWAKENLEIKRIKSADLPIEDFRNSVDLENPTPAQIENLKNITCHFATIRPGDLLYIPALWWHQVSALSHGLSINIFWGEKGDNNFTKKVLTEPTLTAFKYWMLNVVEQNKKHSSWTRILARFPKVLENFLLKQWHEYPTDEQIETIKRFVMQHLKITILPALEANPPKNPPPLKIRGLLHRDRGQGQEKKKKAVPRKLKRTKEENLALVAKKKKFQLTYYHEDTDDSAPL